MGDPALAEYVRLLQEQDRRRRENLIELFFPDSGPLRRELYPKHMEFFRAGLVASERLFMAANRVGKTVAGGFETVCHLTGLYPHWWEGARWERPIDAWAAGDTSETTRDVVQSVLLGEPGQWGTGLIPRKYLRTDRVRMKGGKADAVDTISVKHASGGFSRLGFKSYDQKRRSFQGPSKDWIWLDEECPDSVYDECTTRTMDCNGLVILTFTPLMGLTPLILRFLPGGRLPKE